MKTILVCAIVAAAAFSLVVEPAFGQTTSGQISGQVVDPGNQPIPHVTVTLTNQLTNAQRVATTDDSGAFVFVSVQPGTFSISIAAEAFKTFTKRDLMLTASERLSAGPYRWKSVGSANRCRLLPRPRQCKPSAGSVPR
jgi:hypothetical protein